MPVFQVSESHFLRADCTVPLVQHLPHPAIVIPAVLVSVFLVMVAIMLAARRYQVHRKHRLAGSNPGNGSGLSYSRMEEITEQASGETL